MLTTGQVVKLLNISRPTLYKLCKKKGIQPKKTAGGNYRYSDRDLKQLVNQEGIDTRNIEIKFVDAVNDIWIILKKLSQEVWGLENGEKKLIEILQKNKEDIFILNISHFKEI